MAKPTDHIEHVVEAVFPISLTEFLEIVQPNKVTEVDLAGKENERGVYIQSKDASYFFDSSGNWQMEGDLLKIRVFEGDDEIAEISAHVSDGDIKRIIGEGSDLKGGNNFPVEMTRIY